MAETGVSHQLLVSGLITGARVFPQVPFDQVPAHLKEPALAMVRAMRHKFAKAFQDIPDEDLAVTGLYVLAWNRG
jgi:hypothetical protein